MSNYYRLGEACGDILRGLLDERGGLGGRPQIPEPVLDENEIQGNVLAGFNKIHQALIFLQFADPTGARRWLRSSAGSMATLGEVAAFNRLHKRITARRGGNRGTLLATWVNVALSYDGLAKLTREATLFTEDAFREGMHRRSALLGDPTEPDAEGYVGNWVVGGLGSVPDAVVLVASDNLGRLDEEIAEVRRGLESWARILHLQYGQAPPAPYAAREHFGFRDGVSQPAVRGRLPSYPDEFLAPRRNPANPLQAKPGQALVWPGEFVFGYPRQDPTDPLRPGPVADAGPSWARNGSFLVFRRLRQDVAGFWEFLREAAAMLSATHPQLAGLSPEALGAKCMGRWPSGTPLLRAPTHDIPAIAESECTDDHFQYLHPSPRLADAGPGTCSDTAFPPAPGDADGIICPHAAHVRKAYPRDELSRFGREGEVQTHRLLRRGIPYSDMDSASGERGLLFLAYQTSFERQFEFITRRWLNEPDFVVPAAGHDPIIGRPGLGAARVLRIPLRRVDGVVRHVELQLPEWVTVTGGGYFFAPSVSTLRWLGSE